MSVDSQKATKELLIDPDRKVYSQYHSCKRKMRGDFVEKTLKGDWDTYTDSYSLVTEARIHEDCLQRLQNNGK